MQKQEIKQEKMSADVLIIGGGIAGLTAAISVKEENPDKALDNFKECLKRINSTKNYNHFLNSGFHVILRDESRTIEETLTLAEKAFRLR